MSQVIKEVAGMGWGWQKCCIPGALQSGGHLKVTLYIGWSALMKRHIADTDSNRSYGNHSKPLQIAIRDDPKRYNNLKTLADISHMQLYRIQPLQIATNTTEIAENPCLYH